MSRLDRRGKKLWDEQIYAWCLDVPISPEAFKLWMVLRFAWKNGYEDRMPSYEDLAEKMIRPDGKPCSVRSIARYLGELQVQGLAGREQSRAEKGPGFGNCEFWVWCGEERPPTEAERKSMELQENLPGTEDESDDLDQVDADTPEACVPPVSHTCVTAMSVTCAPPVADATTKKEFPSGESPPKGSPPSGDDRGADGPAWTQMSEADREEQAAADFARFREVFPRRAGPQGEPKARRMLERAIAEVGFTVLLAKAGELRKHFEASGKIGTDFVPAMKTWLADRGWEDTIDPPSTELAKAEARPKQSRGPKETRIEKIKRLGGIIDAR